MKWRLLIPFILILFIIKNVKADIMTPVIYSQYGIMVLGPSTAIKVIIINWIVDFILLTIILF